MTDCLFFYKLVMQSRSGAEYGGRNNRHLLTYMFARHL